LLTSVVEQTQGRPILTVDNKRSAMSRRVRPCRSVCCRLSNYNRTALYLCRGCRIWVFDTDGWTRF